MDKMEVDLRTRKISFALLIICALALISPAMAFELGIIKPICKILPDLSKEMAGVIALIGAVILAVGFFGETKASEISINAMKIFGVVAFLAGIVGLVGQTFPDLTVCK